MSNKPISRAEQPALPAPAAARRRPSNVTPGVAAIHAGLEEQAGLQTRFDAARFRRKEYAADGTELPRPARSK